MTLALGIRRARAIIGLAVVAVAAATVAFLLRPRPAPPPPPVSAKVLAVERDEGEVASQVSTRFDFTRTREGRAVYRVQAERVLGLEGTVDRLTVRAGKVDELSMQFPLQLDAIAAFGKANEDDERDRHPQDKDREGAQLPPESV